MPIPPCQIPKKKKKEMPVFDLLNKDLNVELYYNKHQSTLYPTKWEGRTLIDLYRKLEELVNNRDTLDVDGVKLYAAGTLTPVLCGLSSIMNHVLSALESTVHYSFTITAPNIDSKVHREFAKDDNDALLVAIQMQKEMFWKNSRYMHVLILKDTHSGNRQSMTIDAAVQYFTDIDLYNKEQLELTKKKKDKMKKEQDNLQKNATINISNILTDLKHSISTDNKERSLELLSVLQYVMDNAVSQAPAPEVYTVHYHIGCSMKKGEVLAHSTKEAEILFPLPNGGVITKVMLKKED